MSDTPIKIEVNCETGIAVEVALTAEEIAQREAEAAASLAQQSANAEIEAHLAEVKASAKAKLIAGQPLTAEEADTLVL